MKKADGRKLDHKTREAIRIRAVQQVESGESPEIIIKALGFHRSRIYDWIAKYRNGGLEALRAKKITGRPTTLNGKQIQKLYAIIVDKNPLQLKFEFALWTRDIIREVIKDQFDLKLSAVSVGRLLKKMGFSPQKPLRRAYQQDKDRVEKWLNEEYPVIYKQARSEKAAIFFADESGIRSDFHSGTTWALKGKTPVLRTTGARFSINMISAISAKGHMRFMITSGRMNSELFIEFLKRLIHNAAHPVFLIVDGHPTHKSTKVKKYVVSTQGKLKLFYLPPYSPELNPDEFVWNYVKNHHMGKKEIKGPDDFKQKLLSCLKSLQRCTNKIMGFFHAPNVKYASC